MARTELQKLLPQIQSQIERVGLDRKVIRDAIEGARRRLIAAVLDNSTLIAGRVGTGRRPAGS